MPCATCGKGTIGIEECLASDRDPDPDEVE
jgi:hypothetical protein